MIRSVLNLRRSILLLCAVTVLSAWPQVVFAETSRDKCGEFLETPEGKEAAALDEIVAAISKRTGRIFIQQEHEGNLLQSDLRDSDGDFFVYYELVEPARIDLVRQVVARMSKSARVFYKSKMVFKRDSWAAFNSKQKAMYLSLLEEAVLAEKGPSAVWNNATFLLLRRRDKAPAYVSEHPDFEKTAYEQSTRWRNEARYFSLPEIKTSKDHPARSINEAVERTKVIIKDTGHAGVQYHVFFEMPPEKLRERQDELLLMLQGVNDWLYLTSIAANAANLQGRYILPWGKAQSVAVATFIKQAVEHSIDENAEIFDDMKFAPAGFRYWGAKNGNLVLSFELRSVSIPFKSGSQGMRHGFGEGTAFDRVRDFGNTTKHLAVLRTYAEALSSRQPLQNMPMSPAPALVLSLESVENAISAFASANGIDEKNYLKLREMIDFFETHAPRSGELKGVDGQILRGFFYAFADAAQNSGTRASKTFMENYFQVAVYARELLRAGQESDVKNQAGHLFYLFNAAYRDWALLKLQDSQRNFEYIFRKLAALTLRD